MAVAATGDLNEECCRRRNASGSLLSSRRAREQRKRPLASDPGPKPSLHPDSVAFGAGYSLRDGTRSDESAFGGARGWSSW